MPVCVEPLTPPCAALIRAVAVHAGGTMSRLDSFIRRLEAQRACLDHVAMRIREVPGPVLELGLGNGRTFDHLRELLPGREIFVFEREVRAHPACVPDSDHLLLGDILETLPTCLARLPGPAALAHSDLGTGDAEANAALANWLAATLPPLLAPDAWIIADQPMRVPLFEPQPPPAGIARERYFLYRHRPLA
jgi:S-adenosyl-L-methionine methyltransferase